MGNVIIIFSLKLNIVFKQHFAASIGRSHSKHREGSFKIQGGWVCSFCKVDYFGQKRYQSVT